MLELSFGGSWSDATAINEAGQVVGYAQTAGGETHAFLYDPTQGLEDLNDVVNDPKGFLIQIARAINEKGEILAEGNNVRRLRAKQVSTFVTPVGEGTVAQRECILTRVKEPIEKQSE